MKKLLSAVAICSLISPAFAEPVVYGKANVSFQNADENGASTTELVSNASRLGFKGNLDVEGGLQAIYQAEFEVNMDDGDETFTQRNIFVGLKGDFGTVKAGKFDTPLKEAQKKIDLFNDLEGDIKSMITVNDNRESNVVSYSTPVFGSVVAKVAYISSESEALDDGISTSVAFEQNGIYVAAAFDQNVENEDVSVARLVGQYTISNFQFGALLETVDSDNLSDNLDGWLLSAKYKMDVWAFNAQYGQSDIKNLNGNSLSVGVDYKLAKTLKLFSYYTSLESDDDYDTSEDSPGFTSTDSDYIGVGIELKF
ncbi:MAG: putative porin [Lentisphaeria bacterium]|jgi:predicted porin